MPRIEIAIDPRLAVSGGHTVERALDRVSAATRRTGGDARKLDSNLDQLKRQMSSIGGTAHILQRAIKNVGEETEAAISRLGELVDAGGVAAKKINGAYDDSAVSAFQAIEEALTAGLDRVNDLLTNFIATGKFSAQDLFEDNHRQLTKFALKQLEAEISMIVFTDLTEIADPAKAARQAEAVAINGTTAALSSLATAASSAVAGLGAGSILAPGVQTSAAGFPKFDIGAPTGIDPTLFSGGSQATQKDFSGFGVLFGDVQQTSKAFTDLTTVAGQNSRITMALVRSTKGATDVLSGAFLPALSFAASGLAQLFGGGGGLSKTGQILSGIVGLVGGIAGGFAGSFGGGASLGFGATGIGATGVGSFPSGNFPVAVGGTGAFPLGFASGGSLTVPGFGPDDSRMFVAANSNGPPVMARVSPGENISFTPRGQGGDDETAALLRDLRSLLSRIDANTRGTERALSGNGGGRGFNQDEFSSAADAGVLIQNAVARNK